MTIGILALLAVLVLAFARVPLGFSMLIVSWAGLGLVNGWDNANTLVPLTITEAVFSYDLAVVPMFILMGNILSRTGISDDLFRAAYAFLGSVRGGLALSTMVTCAGFSAVCGSSLATAATMSKVAYPSMKRYGYSEELATATIAAGGTLGILIPPSITMILYGIASETSIGRLFIAGILPGLLLTGLFMAWALFLSWKRGTRLVDADRIYSMKEKLELLPRLLPFIAVIVGVVYALYGGIATPSEAAGVGAALCLVMVMLIYRVWTPDALWKILRDGLRESGMLMLIIGASILFGYMMSSLQVTQSVAEAIGEMQVNRWLVLAAINLMLLVAGMFLPPAAIILMTTPILMPVINAAGFDPIWFGVILTINMELGLITPPVGLNLFVINGITPDIKLPTILKGALPFMGCMVLAIVILCVFPELATWLPQKLMG